MKYLGIHKLISIRNGHYCLDIFVYLQSGQVVPIASRCSLMPKPLFYLPFCFEI